MNSTISQEQFVGADALGRVRFIDEAFGDKALLLSSMQKTSSVLMHLIHRAKSRATILFIDTQFHFPETLAVRDAFIQKFGSKIVTAFPEMTPDEQERHFGMKLYNFKDGQLECCNLRKEKPFLKFAREHGVQAVMDGLMRAEGGARREIQPIGKDTRLNVPVFSPIFDWTEEQVVAYNEEHGVPVNALHAHSYPSIGCMPCTTPVQPGEDKRAGRWRHLEQKDGTKPQYCKINFSDLGEGI